jgi:hypothetical protein
VDRNILKNRCGYGCACLSINTRQLMDATELGVLTLTFGTNILVSVVSLRYPRAPYPPLRTPSKPVVNVTPVRRPVKGLGTSPVWLHSIYPVKSPLTYVPAPDRPTFRKVIHKFRLCIHPTFDTLTLVQLQHIVLDRDATQPVGHIVPLHVILVQQFATSGLYGSTYCQDRS